MAINVSVQYIGGLLPDIIVVTQCYYDRGTRLKPMKRFCICSLFLPKPFDIFPPDWGMLRKSRRVLIFFLTTRLLRTTTTTVYHKILPENIL